MPKDSSVEVMVLTLANSAQAFIKKEALSDEVLPGIAYFEKSLEQRVRELLCSPSAKPDSNIYNPLMVKQLMSDITALLNRCLANQRDYFSLEQQAIDYALQYKAYTDQQPTMKELERASFLSSVIEAKLREGKDESGTLKVLDEALKKRGELVQQLYRLKDEEQERLKGMHEKQGLAMNFKERATEVWSYMSGDLLEAYLKLRALSKSVPLLYNGKFDSLPEWQNADIKEGDKEALGQLVAWVRQTIVLVNREEEAFSECELIIPLKRVEFTAPKLVVGLLNDVDYQAMLKAETAITHEINLKDGLPKGATDLRILSVGASMSIKADETQLFTVDASRARVQITLFPPVVSEALAYGKNAKRPPILLSDVCMLEPGASPRMEAPDHVINLNPAGYEGDSTWRIIVDPVYLRGTKDLALRDEAINKSLSEVYLHLRVAGRFSSDPAKWVRN